MNMFSSLFNIINVKASRVKGAAQCRPRHLLDQRVRISFPVDANYGLLETKGSQHASIFVLTELMYEPITPDGTARRDATRRPHRVQIRPFLQIRAQVPRRRDDRR